MLRTIREIQPTWVVGENVRGLTNWNGGLVFDEVQADLEAQGYEVTPFLLPACAVGAVHRRDRIWFVAYSASASQGAKELRQIRPENGEISREGTQTVYDASRPNGFEGNVTDSNGIGQECREERQCSERGTQSNDKQFKRRNKLPGADFKMFPSVSPICNGDDGLSDKLDGITFPKWRQESIKAGGNAIVPQVVYQIFKAIEQYNELDKQLSI